MRHFLITFLLSLLCTAHAANYLTFTAEEDSSAFGISNKGGNEPDVQYSLDGGKTWKKLKNNTLISLPNKKKALLRGHNPQGISRGDTSFTHFAMTGRIAASGSVMSLIDGKGESLVIPGEKCFRNLFENCTSLTQAPELPATTLAKGCYEGMFRECIRLTHAPELPATTLPDHCYYNMFEDCISLLNAPYPSDTCIASPANNELYGEKKKENGPMDTIDVLRVNQDTTHLKFNTNSIVHKYSFGRRFNRINDSKLEIETLDRQKRFFNCEGCTIARYSVDQKEGIAYLTIIDIVSDSKDDEAHLRTTTQDGELVSDITLNLSPSMTIYLSINDSLIKIDSIGPLPDIKENDKLKLVAIADDGRKLKILQSRWWDDDRMGGTLDDVCTDDQIVNKTFMCLQKKRWKKTWVCIWVMAQESKKIWRPCLRFFWSPKE